MDKLDIIELSRAYVGVFLMSWWGFWSNATQGSPFVNFTSFVSSFGGLI